MTNNITIEQSAEKLACELEQYNWFFDVQVEGGAIVVYVDEMGSNVSKHIPDVFHGYQVKMAFSQYLTAEEKYGLITFEELWF
jgi:hypothetical protein